MRGKKRTQLEQYELFSVLEEHLRMGYSLKKACELASLPYSTIRDMVNSQEALRAKTSVLQNTVNVAARTNIIKSIEKGDFRASKWWIERFDPLESQGSAGRHQPLQTPITWEVVVVEHRNKD